MKDISYEDAYVQMLFDRMGPTYDIVNHISSFGFSTFWRRLCVRNVGVRSGDRVCDMMAGSGECWSHIPAHSSSMVSVDFSPAMISRQRKRRVRVRRQVDVLAENTVQTSVPSA